MALLRLQNKVPDIYVEQSRDFQLFCRLYDVILNGTKYDVDGVARLSNSHDCNSSILKLLQTKLGFFSNKEFTDQALRIILEAFPILVKRKGSELAIKEALYTYLKINDLETGIQIAFINDIPTPAQKRQYGAKITDHCVVIGIESSARDLTALYEILKYIIPFGYNVFFYFYNGQVSEDYSEVSNKLELVLVSNDVNAMAGSVPIVTNSDGSWKDWQTTEESKYTLIEPIANRQFRANEKLSGGLLMYNKTKDELISTMYSEKEIVEEEFTGKYIVHVSNSVTWAVSDEIYLGQPQWYTEKIEQNQIASINTVETEYGETEYPPVESTDEPKQATKVLDYRSVKEFNKN